ncbi:hypothetical protein ACT454_000039 [Enterococcus faecium]|uniref:hypothetical protein n=1 Tax=Enterococcus faecium TaxID=1352 RepID=UPI0006B29A29|nr:hypothetical protein [Enterococcus faecium]EGP5625212.1 hypothetical protein [Enterococcus faecium]MCO5433820.1 hypothetical protein [Enterococcus faecium]MCO5450886.1 hypothetical protein [Enterococcus faecium]ROX57448.1 hypothetical protein EGW37_02465 [Enterococcus faecium]
MREIILAKGAVSRFYRLAMVTFKKLLLENNKLMIHYLLSTIILTEKYGKVLDDECLEKIVDEILLYK